MASDDLSLLSLEDESSRRRSATAADFDDDNEKSLSDSWVKVSAASTIEAQKRQNNQLVVIAGSNSTMMDVYERFCDGSLGSRSGRAT